MDNCDSHSGSFWLPLALTGSLPVSLWLSMALCDSHSGSYWLSLPLSDILWPSLAHYCSLILRIHPLIGSQGPCSALIADATMTHFIPLWIWELWPVKDKESESLLDTPGLTFVDTMPFLFLSKLAKASCRQFASNSILDCPKFFLWLTTCKMHF